MEECIDCMPRRESKNRYEPTVAKHGVSAAERGITLVFGSKELWPWRWQREHAVGNYFSLADSDTFIKP